MRFAIETDAQMVTFIRDVNEVVLSGKTLKRPPSAVYRVRLTTADLRRFRLR
jgi:hypothetical protein